MKYLIAITLPKSLSQKLASVQQLYKSERWNIALPPHITLVPPAKLMSSEGDLKKILTEVAKKFQPLEIKIVGVGRFRNHGNTIFAKVEKSQELSVLQESLSRRLASCLAIENSRKRFHPHITLSNQLKPGEAREKLRDIRKLVSKQSFSCQEISLLQRDDDERRYKKIADFALGEK
ncbi:hypothetical protein COZ63_01695 [Candidatus Berkelbacteria bacterium CG_4_8_14_3_um_filter_42_13]|uniref:2'-5' RNA ligase n=1 Tax=Candidatus Berkelbacteria bacterium CG_4_8_14_3_um_filter_42_13 TaxID=1974505 RepID=A0A2M7K1D7_9BACT|nr:MAG: hypothetical protein COZ63_01695 [Candidatus Berkelbacteria bacterium CG_4_8_14_3_um_filter_42_13]